MNVHRKKTSSLAQTYKLNFCSTVWIEGILNKLHNMGVVLQLPPCPNHFVLSFSFVVARPTTVHRFIVRGTVEEHIYEWTRKEELAAENTLME